MFQPLHSNSDTRASQSCQRFGVWSVSPHGSQEPERQIQHLLFLADATVWNWEPLGSEISRS